MFEPQRRNASPGTGVLGDPPLFDLAELEGAAVILHRDPPRLGEDEQERTRQSSRGELGRTTCTADDRIVAPKA